MYNFSTITETFKGSIRENADSFLVIYEALGVKDEDVSIELRGDLLTVKLAPSFKVDDELYHESSEFCLKCLSEVDTDNITAKLDAGYLLLTLGKKTPKTISIKVKS